MKKVLNSLILSGLLFQVSQAQGLMSEMSSWFIKPASNFMENHPVAIGMFLGAVMLGSTLKFKKHVEKNYFKKETPEKRFERHFQKRDGLKAIKAFIDMDLNEKEKLLNGNVIYPSNMCPSVSISGQRESDKCFVSSIYIDDKENKRTKTITMKEWVTV